ncbi:MAG: MFS transporter [Magnetococcales bacterium]|nr:MFS transporter [Magnetococcales bacterium]
MKFPPSTGIIFLAVFLDLLGFGMVLPLMPLYAADPRFAATPEQIGWLMAIYSLMQFLFAPWWGWLSDRMGRRPALIAGLIGSALSYLAYGMATSLWMLFAARAAAGIMGANIAVAQAALADLSSPEERSRAMGLIGAAFGLGFILGPAFGGWLARFGVEAAPLGAALITGLNALAAIRYLPETRTVRQPTRTRLSHPLFSLAPGGLARQYPGALTACMLMGLFVTLFSGFEVTLPLWGKDLLQWDMTTVGWLFTYVGVVAVIVQGGVLRHIVKAIGEKNSALAGLLCVAGGLALLRPGGWPAILTAMGIIAIGSGLVHPSLSGLASLNTDPERQGIMLGVFQSMSALGRGIGPVLGGMAYPRMSTTLFLMTATGLLGVALLLAASRRTMRDARSFYAPTRSPDAP